MTYGHIFAIIVFTAIVVCVVADNGNRDLIKGPVAVELDRRLLLLTRVGLETLNRIPRIECSANKFIRLINRPYGKIIILLVRCVVCPKKSKKRRR